MTTITHGWFSQSVDAAKDGASALTGSGFRRMSLTSANVAVTATCFCEYAEDDDADAVVMAAATATVAPIVGTRRRRTTEPKTPSMRRRAVALERSGDAARL